MSKKKNIKTDLIPYQNVTIGVLVSIIYLISTKNFSESILASGLFAGGIYDLVHNITKMEWYIKLKDMKKDDE